MNYAKMSKDELIKLLESQELQLGEATTNSIELDRVKKEHVEFKKEFAAAIELREQAINNEFTLRKEKEKLQQELSELRSQKRQADEIHADTTKMLEDKLNSLATLFEEYIVSYKDQIKIFDLYMRNFKNMDALLDSKIVSYNEGRNAK